MLQQAHLPQSYLLGIDGIRRRVAADYLVVDGIQAGRVGREATRHVDGAHSGQRHAAGDEVVAEVVRVKREMMRLMR